MGGWTRCLESHTYCGVVATVLEGVTGAGEPASDDVVEKCLRYSTQITMTLSVNYVLITLFLSSSVMLIGCGDNDEPAGPPPDESLSSPVWKFLEARSGSGQGVEPVTRLINEGARLELTFARGLYRFIGPPCIYGAYPVKYPGNRIELRNASLGNAATGEMCETTDLEQTRRQLLAVIPQFIAGGVQWSINSGEPATLTLTGVNGTVYRFVQQ
jgi:hypothetical protein